MIEIADDGPGVRANLNSFVFEKFATTRKAEATTANWIEPKAASASDPIGL